MNSNDNIYKVVLDVLKRLNINSSIKCIALIGSSLFWDDPNDTDYLVILDHFETKSGRFNSVFSSISEKKCFYIYDENFYKSILNFKNPEIYSKGFLYIVASLNPFIFKPENILYGDYQYFSTFFENETTIKKSIKEIIENKGITIFNKEERKNPYKFPKSFYFLYLILSFLKNQDNKITTTILDNMRNIKLKENNFIESLDWIFSEINNLGGE